MLMYQVTKAIEVDDATRAAGLLSGALAVLRDNSNVVMQSAMACGILLSIKTHVATLRTKKLGVYVATFIGSVHLKPVFCKLPQVLTIFCAFRYLPRKSTTATKHTLNPNLPLVVCAVLIELLRESVDWPLSLLQVGSCSL